MSENTKLALKQAFMNLLEEHPFDDITVNMIAEECHVNRNTLYYHFQDIYDLLNYAMDLELKALIAQNEANESFRKQFNRLYDFIMERQKIVYHIYYSMERDVLERFLMQTTKTTLMDSISEKMKSYPIPKSRKEIIVHSLAYVFVGYFLDWIRDGMQEDIGEKFEDIIRLAESNEDILLSILAQH